MPATVAPCCPFLTASDDARPIVVWCFRRGCSTGAFMQRHQTVSNSIAEKVRPCQYPQSAILVPDGIRRATSARCKRYVDLSAFCSRYNVDVDIEMQSGDYSND